MTVRQSFGPFVLHRSLAKSALSESFLAETPWPEMPVAAIEIYERSFETLPRDLIGLEHPNLVKVLGIGSIGGRTYVASEVVPGKTVARIVARIRALRRPTPVPIAVRLWNDVLSALVWLHERYPHGAVTPENVVVAYTGAAKLSGVPLPNQGTIESDLFGAASAIMRLLGRELPAPLDELMKAMLSRDREKGPPTARAALDRLIEASTGEREPAPRALVSQWISELFAGEKAEELEELNALRGRRKRDEEEELRWFDAADETSTSSWTTFEGDTASGEQGDIETQLLSSDQLPFGNSEETSPQLIEAGETERAAIPRNAKVPTMVLDDDPSGESLPSRTEALEETFGPYRILGKIADGGMAEVLLAESGAKRCVLKRIAPSLRVDRDFSEMFQEEARIVRHLHHPNIAACLDAGTIDGVAYIAFELIEGLELGKLIPERMPISAAIEAAIGIVRALDYAHRIAGEDGRRLEVVHRDVSPENVVIDWRGQVKLLDFGISRFRDRSYATRAGVVKGKLGYLAPEQLGIGPIDARTDLYQAGVVLAEMLSGQRLFPGDAMSRPRTQHEARVLIERHLAGAPSRLIDLVARLVAPDPNARPASAQHALAELEELRRSIEGPSLSDVMRDRAPPGSRAAERTKVERARAWIPAIAGVLLLVTAAVAVAVYVALTS